MQQLAVMQQRLVLMEQELHRSIKLNQRYELVIDKLVGVQPEERAVSGKFANAQPKLGQKLVIVRPKPRAASGPLS